MKITRKRALRKTLEQVFTNLNNLTRWPQLTGDVRYNQLNKLGLGTLISFFVATIVKGKEIPVKWELFPKFAIEKAIAKAAIANTPETQLKWFREEKGIDHVAEQVVKKQFKKIPDFFIDSSCCIEQQIFRLSGKLASLMELDELKGSTGENPRYKEAYDTKTEEIREFQDLFNSISSDWECIEPLISEFSVGLRSQSRWMLYCRTIECSVLGHLFETAVFAYIMAIELGYDEKIATECFFMGIAHDLAETRTLDMPSPVKDAIPGLREATEEYEALMMEENFYQKMPKYLADALKAIDFERPENQIFRKLIKGADYVSAALECRKQRWGGVKDKRYRSAAFDILWKTLFKKIEVSSIGRRIVVCAAISLML